MSVTKDMFALCSLQLAAKHVHTVSCQTMFMPPCSCRTVFYESKSQALILSFTYLSLSFSNPFLVIQTLIAYIKVIPEEQSILVCSNVVLHHTQFLIYFEDIPGESLVCRQRCRGHGHESSTVMIQTRKNVVGITF